MKQRCGRQALLTIESYIEPMPWRVDCRIRKRAYRPVFDEDVAPGPIRTRGRAGWQLAATNLLAVKEHDNTALVPSEEEHAQTSASARLTKGSGWVRRRRHGIE
jgi:hypothetical protein